jgi:hypothetical protein
MILGRTAIVRYLRRARERVLLEDRDSAAYPGLKVGDRLRADVRGPGQVTLAREDDPLEQFAGALTGVYLEGYFHDLRREWTRRFSMACSSPS